MSFYFLKSVCVHCWTCTCLVLNDAVWTMKQSLIDSFSEDRGDRGHDDSDGRANADTGADLSR